MLLTQQHISESVNFLEFYPVPVFIKIVQKINDKFILR